VLGNATGAACWRISGHKHQERVVAALAGLAQAREPLPGPGEHFAEYAAETNSDTKKKDVGWFSLNEDRPPFAFAGIWTDFNGDRGTKSKPIPGPHLVYGFPDNCTKRHRRTDPSQSHAGDSDDGGGA
jgi:hypothetical protein